MPCSVTLIIGVCVVVQCKTAAYVGLHGIMVRETKETFGIVTEDNRFKGNNFLPSTENDVLDLLFASNCLSDVLFCSCAQKVFCFYA